MNAASTARGVALVFTAAMLQSVIVSSLVIGGGAPDLLLLVVVAFGLVRGSLAGAAYGFVGGLVVDLVTLDTLGVTSLVLTLAGFWAGRYGETTGRDRRYAPYIAAAAITVLAAVLGFVLHYLLGDQVVARQVFLTALVPMVALNLVLARPVYALARRVVGLPEYQPLPEVEVLV